MRKRGTLLSNLWSYISGLSTWEIISSFLDIVIVAFVLYRVLLLIRGTRAVQLIKGLIFLVIASYVSKLLHFYTINWILSQAWAIIIIALAVIFQPELRRLLEQLGRGQFVVFNPHSELGTAESMHIVDEIAAAVIACAKTKTGMLIVMEQETGLNDYCDTGVKINAEATHELLCNIFVPNTPLHDGAVIIRGGNIMAAACFLPLSDNPDLSSNLGTRHRAALGISEVCDAYTFVVSEETGIISYTKDGKLYRYLDEKKLRETLSACFMSRDSLPKRFLKKGGAKNE